MNYPHAIFIVMKFIQTVEDPLSLTKMSIKQLMLNTISKIIVIIIILNKYHSDYKERLYFIHCYTQPNTIYQHTCE
jgi:hypothetical protein